MNEENDPSLLLLEGRYAPITSEIGFIEADCATVVEEYLAWQRSLERREPVHFSATTVTGELHEALARLTPLVDIQATRHLFAPTDSGWTAYFDNGWRGGDVLAPVSYLGAQRIGCCGVRASAHQHTLRRDERGAGQYGAVQFGVWSPEGAPPLKQIRSVHVANDGGRWTFGEFGTPYPFEDTARYKARRIGDRFTFAMLRRYLEALGIKGFDERFYMPAREATLVERRRAGPPRGREFDLAEVRASRRLD